MGSITYMISLIVFALGLVIVIFPRHCTKKELQSDGKVVGKNRIIGIVITVIGAAMLAVNFKFIQL